MAHDPELASDIPEGDVSHAGRPSTLGVLGAGRQALETCGYCAELGLAVVFLVEEVTPGYLRDPAPFAAPILAFRDLTEVHLRVPVTSAVGSPNVRRRLIERWGRPDFVTVVSARAWLAADVEIGTGTTVAPLAAVNRHARIGAHVLVNVGALISHDVHVDNFVTVSPGCVIGGGVSVGAGAFLGLGSTIRDHVNIGSDAVVAAGAVVVADVADGQTVMGVPARPRRGE